MQSTYKDCIAGAESILARSLNVQPEERVLLVKSPEDTTVNDLMAASSILWWCKPVHSTGFNCESSFKQLIQDRLDIENALRKAAEIQGCAISSRTIDTSTLLDEHFNWRSKDIAKGLLNTMKDFDVIIDLTLFGLDQLPPTKKSREPRFSFQDEIRKHSDARGVDMHLVSRSSFSSGGCMNFDLSSIAKELIVFKELIMKSSFLTVKSDETNLKLSLLREKTDIGSGIIRKPKYWHFLPSGVVFVPVKIAGTFGTVRLDGPTYGLGSLKDYPLRLKVSPATHQIERFELSDNAPSYIRTFVEEMFKIEECRHIGELVIGFNTMSDKESLEPMEFYVARGNVTIALGRNDHIGGEIYPHDPAKPSIHVHASISNPTVVLDNGREIVKDGSIVSS
jgi:hypothetical protein